MIFSTKKVVKIKIPEKECGQCRFFYVDGDPAGYCFLYDRDWIIDKKDEAFLHDDNALKPEFCEVEEVFYEEVVYK